MTIDKILTEDDLTLFRSCVAELDSEEKVALAAILAMDCATNHRWCVFRKFTEPLSADLANAVQHSDRFSKSQKLAFALELLHFGQKKEEEDGWPAPTDYEGEEYYSSDRPLLDDNALNEPTHGYPGYWNETL